MTQFGGPWTEKKLDILEDYLEQYLLVLKNYRDYFNLLYIDAFAGDGEIHTRDREGDAFIEGSVRRALKTGSERGEKPFDEFVFNEINPEKIAKLEKLKEEFPDKNITITRKDANKALKGMCANVDEWRRKRAVLFIDPFSTELEWTTLEAIAKTKAIDTWLLFPVNAINRMTPRAKEPSCAHKLNQIFGDNSWENLYTPQKSLFSNIDLTGRKKGENQFTDLYKKRLKSIFGDHLLEESKTLIFQEKNKILFEFIFAAGSPKGRKPAHEIARHLMKKI